MTDLKSRQYKIEVTMPSGEKLEPVMVDGEHFLHHRSSDVGAVIGRTIGQMIEQRLKA